MLLQDYAAESVGHIQIEGFDLKPLALFPAVEQTAPVPRLSLRGTMTALAMALLAVSALATLPASAVIARACSVGN